MSDGVVVDASLVAKWFLNEHDTFQALVLRNQWAEAQIRLHAPTLLASELANLLHRRAAHGSLVYTDAYDILTTVLGGLVAFDGDPALSVRALDIAHRFNLSAAYDAHYLALAERDALPMWTADERFYNSLKARMPLVHWIGEKQAKP